MEFPRAGGILLHPTSLPGRYGIGELGSAAHRFVDFLAESNLKLWQVLPLGPTGYGDSPYQVFSAFAGNPLLISLEWLAGDGWLGEEDLKTAPDFPLDEVDYGPVIEWKGRMLRRAYENFKVRAGPSDWEALRAFADENQAWLADYALFMAVKEAHGGVIWSEWEREIALREPAALAAWRERLADAIVEREFLQWQFTRQWSSVKRYANERRIQIIGDIPIFVAYDSADVWAHPELFFLDERGAPTVVAGVPPDYFSKTGQLWGNPLYRWDRMRANGYAWWIERFRQILTLVDIVRIDHFRGFEAYWEVPAGAPTAETGRWVKGPGADLFQAVRDALGELPIIAEDLGLITPEVEALRDALGFPGMRILQFAFEGDASNPFLPHNFVRNTVIYTGSHDNDTTAGWYETATEHERDFVRRYLDSDGSEIAWKLVRLAFSSVANQAIVPLQDVLGLGTEARMNFPGRPSGNWRWRYRAEMLTPELSGRLRELVRLFGR